MILVALRSKASVDNSSLLGLENSNTAKNMHVRLLCLLGAVQIAVSSTS
jgi:hypothetical protein